MQSWKLSHLRKQHGRVRQSKLLTGPSWQPCHFCLTRTLEQALESWKPRWWTESVWPWEKCQFWGTKLPQTQVGQWSAQQGGDAQHQDGHSKEVQLPWAPIQTGSLCQPRSWRSTWAESVGSAQMKGCPGWWIETRICKQLIFNQSCTVVCR